MSDWALVGGDDKVRVHRTKTGGAVSITLLQADPPRSLYMTAAEAATAGELLGRAAMPDALYACCGHCDHDGPGGDGYIAVPHRQPCNGEGDEGCAQGSAALPATEASQHG